MWLLYITVINPNPRTLYHFQGNWLEQFDPAKTRDEDFRPKQGENVRVRMMYQEKKFKYGYSQDIGAKVRYSSWSILKQSSYL